MHGFQKLIAKNQHTKVGITKNYSKTQIHETIHHLRMPESYKIYILSKDFYKLFFFSQCNEKFKKNSNYLPYKNIKGDP